MQLAELVATSRAVADVRKRLEKISLLAACLRRVEPEAIEIAAAYLSGAIRQGRIGIGPALLRDAAAAAPPAAASELTLLDVDRTLEQIATTSGRGSALARGRALRALFGRATEVEHRFLARLLVGELRQGALEGMMLDAVAKAADVPASAVRRALMLEPDLGAVAGAALREGEAGLARFGLALFQPLKPMLASPAADVGSALGQLGEAALEYKLDGVRIQVHKRGDDVRVFTRRLHDVTPAVPDVVEAVRGFPAHELILDGEVLTFRSDGRPQPFQTTMRRFGRRLDVARLSETLALRPFFFDCLHVDGESLIDRRCDERVGALESAIPAGHRIRRIVTAAPEEAEVFLRSALQAGHEGVMAKSLAATYEAGGRGAAWLKLKPVHTLDLVVLAAEWGHGRRKGWLSNLHLGARDPATGDFAMLGKTFKGMTDETLTWQTRQLLALETARDAHTVYVRPELVVEVAFNEVQTSPRYPAGMALRFARLKSYRLDKRAQDADTLDSVRAIHEGRTRLV